MSNLIDINIPVASSPEEPKAPRPPLINEHGVMRIDNSSLEHFTTCARSAEYYLLNNRQLNRSKSALNFGSAIHECLELLYTAPEGTSHADLINQAKQVIDQTPAPDDADDFRTPQRALDTFISYLAVNEFEPFTVAKTPEGKPLIELYFEIPLGSVEFLSEFNGKQHTHVDVVWSGRIDAIIEMDNKLWIMDHKTTTILGENFFADFLNSQQTIGYTWAAQQLIGKPIEGLYLNAIAIRKQTKTGTPFEVHRKRFPYEQERIEEWTHNTLTLVSDFLSHYDRKFFPMETKWCVGKYGKCPYFDVCTLPKSQRASMLASNFYRDVTWTPKNR